MPVGTPSRNNMRIVFKIKPIGSVRLNGTNNDRGGRDGRQLRHYILLRVHGSHVCDRDCRAI